MGTVEAWVKRVKHVGNEEEASKSTSNDAIVALLGRSVGEHAGPQDEITCFRISET